MSTFGIILPTLIQQIKKILDQYPDDSQILKELIQNAEDAGAKEVKFLVDYHSYAQENLYHPGLAKYQGPALYAYNDATFTEDDWKGVQLLCDSIKVKDPTKVGRFGLGFKSVFHITDLPSVVSGDNLGIIDPHEKYFSDEDGKRSGFQWHLRHDSVSMKRIADQFAPYKTIFDCTENAFQQGRYEGTLFRLPFRQESSKLSDTIYSKDKIQGLCKSFASDAHLVLLFLMNLERIEFYERNDQMSEPRKLFSVGISDQCKAAVREVRQRFNSKVKQMSCDPLTETYRVEIEILDFMGGTNRKSLHSFVITHYISGSNLSTEMRELVNDESLSYMPRIGVALPLNPNKLGVIAREPQGHLFCFLPLPLEAKSLTGLPVHVNGFFALSQNRRHLKWPSADQKNPKDKSLRWNNGLLREVLPNAYAELIRSLIQTLQMPSETVYTAWPDPSKVDIKWSVILKPLWLSLFHWKVLYSKADGGVWCTLKDVIFDNFKECDKSRKTVINLLNSTGKNIVTVPNHVRIAAERSCAGLIKEITAGLLRSTLKAKRFCYVHLPNYDKISILKFVLSDSKFANLEGLQLLPLSNKTFIDFLKKPSSSNVVYIDSRDHPRTLLPGMQTKFLSNVDKDVTKQLENAVRKGYTQLRHLDANAVKSHLREALPSEWMQSNGQVTWYPGKLNHPTIQWLEELWRYFGVYFNSNNGLDAFLGFPLIPLSTKSMQNQKKIQLVRIQRPSTLILQSFNGEQIDGPVSVLLSAVGVTVLENLPGFVKGHYSLVPAYINPPNPRGVLNALIMADVGNQQHPCLQTDMRTLRGFLSRMPSFTQNEIDFLRKLKLFDTHPGSGSQSRPVALNQFEIPLAAPVDDFPPVPSYVYLVDLREPSSRAVAHLLGTQPMSHIKLMEIMLNQALKDVYSDTELDELVKYILDRLGLFRMQQGIMAQLRRLAFVISGDNCRKKPEELFDPEGEHLKDIFTDEPEKFPKNGSFFSKPNVLMHLRTLGLKRQEDLSAADILKSAVMVNQIEDVKKAKAKSEAILKHLEDVPALLQKPLNSKGSLAQQLYIIPWVPVFVRETGMYPMHLPRKCDISFACPRDATSAKFLNLVGSVKTLVEVPQYPQVSHYFGWNGVPKIDDVINHLRNVIHYYQEDEKNTFIVVMKAIYRYLASANVINVMAKLRTQQIDKWIWNGDGFSSPREVVIEEPWLNLQPYLCSLPKDTKEFVEFFSACGVNHKLDNKMLLDILRTIKDKHEYKTSSHEVKRDLQHSIDILNEFSPQGGETLALSLRENLLVPVHVENDETLELAPVDECTYCDREWLKQGRDDGDINDTDDVKIKFIHHKIPIATAEVLGIPTLMSRILDTDELEMGEGFGQSESLLDRLKGLLEGYTDGLSVPKELIQNADDAGATEIRFLYDERTNEDAMTHLLDKGMKECQGPALWSYNDAVFTDDDFQNIVKLNAATKEDDAGKIGRFGLGFNSVYNLTDVPSFVSRDSIVILDPHTTYLGKAIRDKSKPGIKFNLSTKPLRQFSKQFMPYNGVFGCDLRPDGQKKFYNGTLFRFPLRTKTQALNSGIKQLHYDVMQVKELLQMLLNGSESLLLFTQNILTIRVFHLSNEKSEILQPVELFSISKSCVEVIHRLKYEASLSTAVQKLSTEKQEFVKQSSILRASSEFKRELEKRATKVASAPAKSLMKSAMVLTTDSKLSGYGNQFFSNNTAGNSTSPTIWLVHSCTVSGSALEMSLHAKGLLPTAGVATQLVESSSGDLIPKPMRNSSEESSYQSGHVFCFLPLPIRSGLPVHINGCFAVDDSRRHLREKTEDDKFERGAKWNRVLMSEVVCQAYVGLLEDLKTTCPVNSFIYHSLWPQAKEILQQHCHGLASEIYRKLCSRVSDAQITPLELFSNGVQWSAVDSVVFLEPSFKNDPRINKAAQIALNCFAKSKSLIAIDMPDQIFNSFEIYGFGKNIRNHCFDKESFFKNVVFPLLGVLKAPERDCLVLYAIDEASPVLNDLVRNNRCIPVSPSGRLLKCPKDLIDPNRKAAQLYESDDAMFPYCDQFCTEERLLKLSKLGMRDHLEWKEVIERANSVKKLQSYDQSLSRTKLLLELIDDKLRQTQHFDPNIQIELQQTQFLPILKKPQTFPFQWKGDEYEETTFLAAVDLHHKSYKYLVSASAPILGDGRDGCRLLGQSSKVGTFLHIIKEVSLDQAKLQLHTVITTKAAYRDSVTNKELQKACEELYAFFQRQPKHTKEEVKRFLAPLNFLLIGNQFLNASQMAFESRVNFLPYFYKVPFEYRERFYELLRLVGVRKAFEIPDYIKTLTKVKDKHGDSPIDNSIQAKVKEVLVLLVEAMTKAGISTGENMAQYDTIYLPDSNDIMKPAGELCIKDCYWMPDEEGIKYVNAGIHPEVCLALGVNSRRQKTLSKFAISFGQKEKLTNRIKRILTGYPCDRSIMKELLQNADDAKASKICFIKDPRQHPDERVLEESWKPLQGPALCVYNNAPFTNSDIKGIQNLGEGSKGDDPNKTGQYGVGFNAVYHLTDVPSFISKGKEIGEVMCVFDPNLKYAPCATQDSPGVMYNDLDCIRNTFTDVLPCYLEQFEDQFPIDNGTMFRFPLRNDEMAKNSNISKKPVTIKQLNDLMKDFQDDLLETLLFVNHVKEISTCEIDNSGSLKTIYHVKTSMSPEDEEKRKVFASDVNSIGNKLRSKEMPISEIPKKKVSYVLHIEDSKGRCQDWLVVQQIGLECPKDITKDVSQAFERGDLGLLPRGGVASLISFQDKPPGKAFCFLPLPFQTGLPAHINGHFALDHEARRNLWRSDHETGDYRSKWNDILLRQVVAPCYVVMLEEIRPLISLAVTADNKTNLIASWWDVESSLSNYEKYFPSLDVLNDPYWKILALEVYCHLDTRKKCLLPVLRTSTAIKHYSQDKVQVIEWFSPTDKDVKAFFDNLLVEPIQFNPREDPQSKAKRMGDLRDTLLGVGFNLLHMSMEVYHCFVESGITANCISPKEVLHFFHSYGSTNLLSNQIGPLPLPIESTPFQSLDKLLVVLNYCKDEESFFKNLRGLPLLLTEDNQLRVFDETKPVFLSKFSDLLPTCHHLFVHSRLFNSVFLYQNKKGCMGPVFKMFNVTEFARLLPYVLDESCYRSSRDYFTWNPLPEDKTIPSGRWIRRVWQFFHHLVKTDLKDYDDQANQVRVSQTTHQPHKELQLLEEQQHKKMMAEKKQLILEALDPVMDWCLLPATQVIPPENVKHLLVPLRMAQTVFFSGSSISPTNLSDTIQKMCLPELNCRILRGTSVVDSTGSAIAKQIVSNLIEPMSFLAVLLQKLKSDPASFDRLREDDYVNVLRYFNDHKQMLQPRDVEGLKLLPIYPTVHGKHISISGKQAFALPSRIPKNDMNKWENEAGIVFLIQGYYLKDLYSFLGCDSKDEVDVYCDIIFKRFQEMTKEARLVHIEFVRRLMNELLNELDTPLLKADLCFKKSKKDKLVQGLYVLEFDLGRDGSLRRASSLYDPSNEVFNVMFENQQEKFPAEPFCEHIWLSFLRKIGLIHEVTNELFLQFAHEVEREGRTSSANTKTKAKSETLVSYLFKKENLATHPILDNVKDICFIFPKEIGVYLGQIHKPFGRQPCVCFKGSVASPHFIVDIAWTTVSILPDYANPFTCRYFNPQYDRGSKLNNRNNYTKEIISRLGILESPTVEMVVNHCKNICNALCQRNDDAANRVDNSQIRDLSQNTDVVIEVMKSIYKFLQDKYRNNESVIKAGLQNTRCIVVEDGKRFVYPRQIVVEMMPNDEIHPYLFKVPRQLGDYVDLFQNLGSTVTVTAAQYAMVLDTIHVECRDAKLNPNETTNAFKATKGLFESIVKDGEKPLEIQTLYLPGVKRNLDGSSLYPVFVQKSTEIFYNDAPHFKDRLKGFQKLLLVKLKECGLKVDNDDCLIIQLPESIRPLKLTSIVNETLPEGGQFALSSTGSTKDLTRTLTSNEFCSGLTRLIKHAAYHRGSQIKDDIQHTLRKSLQCVHVHSVAGLRTRLVCEETTIPESEAGVSCFEEKTKEGNEEVCNIYVEENVELTEYISRVAEIVNRITGNQLGEALVHLAIILLRPLDKIQACLDVLQIREDNASLEGEATYFPSPGSFIHVDDQHLLVDAFTVFLPGEYVGYELDDPSLRGEDGAPTYIYAIIIEEVSSEETSPITKKYNINIGEEKIVVDAVKLYKFYRYKQTEGEGMEMEVFTGSDSDKQNVKPDNLDEAKRQVRQTLEEAWNLPEETRKGIMKRLFLTWHPDKNPGNEEFCTEVFKFIQAEIKRLERGLEPQREGNVYRNHEYHDDFERWTRRAQSHGTQRSRARTSGSWGGSYGGFSSSSGRPNPQPGEAGRWYRQAKADLDAVINDTKTSRPSYEWACFKCHQSAEKALKAAQYSLNADLKSNTHSLPGIACSLGNHDVISLASSLEILLGSSARMRYPDHHYHSIPHENYTERMAEQALEYATKILNEVKANFVN